jgi:AGZA family xanthine/uracil permease-like MFS transporter
MCDVLERWFGLRENGTGVITELRAGLTTFLTMAYIMFVNPVILSGAGMDFGAVFVATCLAAAIGTALMGLFANYPVALAPGMGLNAYFAFTVVPAVGGDWRIALGCVFLSGLLFLAISVTPLREKLINAIPQNLKLGIAAGIGLFLAIIGLNNAGLIADHPATLVTLGDLTSVTVLLACAGFLLIAALTTRKIPGAILIGVLAVTIAAVLMGYQPFKGVVAAPPSLAPTFMQMDLAGAFAPALIVTILTFLLVDLLDTAGTLIAVGRQGNLLDEEGRLPRLRPALLADSTATVAGAALGTSTTTSYIESASGIEDGGRTGLTALTVAMLFLISIVLAPLAETVPGYATAPALLFVACLMVGALRAVSWDEPSDYVPAAVTAIAMPFTYSIATGIGLGFIVFVILKLATGRWREVNWAVALVAVLFAGKIAFG